VGSGCLVGWTAVHISRAMGIDPHLSSGVTHEMSEAKLRSFSKATFDRARMRLGGQKRDGQNGRAAAMIFCDKR